MPPAPAPTMTLPQQVSMPAPAAPAGVTPAGVTPLVLDPMAAKRAEAAKAAAELNAKLGAHRVWNHRYDDDYHMIMHPSLAPGPRSCMQAGALEHHVGSGAWVGEPTILSRGRGFGGLLTHPRPLGAVP
jgi:hypothetical protein